MTTAPGKDICKNGYQSADDVTFDINTYMAYLYSDTLCNLTLSTHDTECIDFRALQRHDPRL